MANRVVHVLVQGTSALLQSRFSDQAEAELEKASRGMLAEKVDRRQLAEQACYRNPEGHLWHPGPAILKLLREAGGNHKLKASRKSAKFLVPSAVLVLDDQAALVNPESGEPIEKFEVDSRSVVNAKTKGRVMCHRPRLDHWGLKFRLEINEQLLPEDFVHKLLEEGGQQIGVGAYRPEKGGPFGRFRVIQWKLE